MHTSIKATSPYQPSPSDASQSGFGPSRGTQSTVQQRKLDPKMEIDDDDCGETDENIVHAISSFRQPYASVSHDQSQSQQNSET